MEEQSGSRRLQHGRQQHQHAVMTSFLAIMGPAYPFCKYVMEFHNVVTVKMN
ncbi:hypothetical protein DPMN_170766 [Dreissena polymorpha]|uniref:Uncharacterized protein n=1 Tax=Dreissena polymorpha TaxID=45954 RepID=A0A9D4DYG2_DREPO|nr:hypothetical protein DPMN_170766 [Dreissena polymorpha]